MKLFDLHCDTAYECVTRLSSDIDKGAFHVSLDRGSSFDSWHQFFAIFMPDELRGNAAIVHYERVLEWINRQARLFPERFFVCRSAGELLNAEKPGVCGAMISVEGGSAVAGSLERIQRLYDDGIRMMTLTWNAENEIGFGASTNSSCGLKPFGREAVKLMNRLGMIVDISHLSDRGFWDVAECSSSPFVASHSCSRELCSHRRNLTDEMFNCIINANGLVGLNFCRGFLQPDRNACMDDIIRHAEHFLSLGGEDVLCLGSDFDGTDMPDLISGVESMPTLYERFLQLNYSEALCDKIFFDNCRVFFSNNLK